MVMLSVGGRSIHPTGSSFPNGAFTTDFANISHAYIPHIECSDVVFCYDRTRVSLAPQYQTIWQAGTTLFVRKISPVQAD